MHHRDHPSTRPGRSAIRPAVIMATAAMILGTSAADAAAPTTRRVSIRSSGTQADDASDHVAISANGRFTVFESAAKNLVPSDTNGSRDIFVHDRRTGRTRRVSVRSNGSQGNDSSTHPDISGDGRFVAFQSEASDLVPGDTNGTSDVFVHDRRSGQTRRVSVRSNGSQGNGQSTDPAISGDGRYVAFVSRASDLVKGDTNSVDDVFVHDRLSGRTRRVSVRTSGLQADEASDLADISADGRLVAFEADATNLVAGDTNAESDIFVHDLRTGRTTRVSVRSNGAQGIGGGAENPAISASGRYVAFDSSAENLVGPDSNGEQDIFVHDRRTGRTRRVSLRSDGSQLSDFSSEPSLSANGRYVVFTSNASDLVSNDTNGQQDVFLKDRASDKVRRVSVRTGGAQADHASIGAAISDDGRFVAFESTATDLVANDTNALRDVFVRGPLR